MCSGTFTCTIILIKNQIESKVLCLKDNVSTTLGEHEPMFFYALAYKNFCGCQNLLTIFDALHKAVEKLYPGNEIHFNYHHKDIPKLELDVFLPELSLALEYQGEPHFFQIPVYGSSAKLKQNDILKKRITKGINKGS